MDEDRAGKEAPNGPAGRAEVGSSWENGSPSDLSGIFRQVPVGRNSQPRQPEKNPQPADEPGFTQMFQSLQDGGSASSNARVEQGGQARVPEAAREDPVSEWSADPPGEFTRMFRPLRADARAQEFHVSSPYRERASHTRAPTDGGFTQLLRTLSTEEAAGLPSERAPLQEAKPVPGEPGEFTRIVSRSAMREASLREQEQHAAEPQPQPAASAVPSAFTAAALPLSSLEGEAAGAQRFATPHILQQPAAPAVPPAARAVPKSTAAGRLQQYVPLLLIANLFLTAIALILQAVALARH